MKKLSILYVRTSSIDQNLDRQRVQEANYDKVIEDKISGAVALFERPGGKELFKLISMDLVGSVSFWQIDRCGRDLKGIVRKQGTSEDPLKFLSKSKNRHAMELLKKNYKSVEISKITGLHINTITKVKKLMMVR